MESTHLVPMTKRAVLVMAEIKAAAEAFDRGDTNVYDALDAVKAAVERYGEGADTKRKAA